MATVSFNPLSPDLRFRVNRRNSRSVVARLKNNSETKSTPSQRQQQQLNLSVLRFTLGIPGLDESNLPRWMGYGFGSLILLNHFLSSDIATTPAQLRTEALGLSLAVFSISLPYLGKFLKGASPIDQPSLPEGVEQIFVMSENISDTQKEDLAWATYILLRNTNAIAVLVSIQGALCVRGYWNVPDDVSKSQMLDWFERHIDNSALNDLKDTLYFPSGADFGFREILPSGIRSLLVQPVQQTQSRSAPEMEKIKGFFMLASCMSYAYSDKDQAWIKAVANKFRDPTEVREVAGNFDQFGGMF